MRALLAVGLTLAICRFCYADDHTDVVREYLRARTTTLRGNATSESVDRVIAYYTSDVIYEDPAVHMRVEGADQLRRGMLSHLNDYAGSERDTNILVESIISVGNAVAVKIAESFSVKADAGPKKIDRLRLNVIEFRDGKICRIIDYH